MQGPLRRQRVNRRHRLAAVAQLAVRAVLDDEEVAFARQRDQRLPLRKRHRLPARILEIRNHVAEFHRDVGSRSRLLRATVATRGLVNGRGPSVSLGGMSAKREVVPGQAAPAAEGKAEFFQCPDIGTIGLEGLQGAEVGRARGEDYVAGIGEHARADVDPLLRGGRDLDVLHRHAVAPGDHLPQLRHALRGAVLERLGPVAVEHLRADAADVVQREGRRVGIAAGEGIDGREVHLLEDLAHRRAHERPDVLRKEFAIIHEKGIA